MQIIGAYLVFVVGMAAVGLAVILCAAIVVAGYEGVAWLRAAHPPVRQSDLLARR